MGAGEPAVSPVLGSKTWELLAQVLPGKRERRGERNNLVSLGFQQRAPRRAHLKGRRTPGLQRPGCETEFVSLASSQRVDAENRELRAVDGAGLSVHSPPASLCSPSGTCGKRGGSWPGPLRKDLLSQPGVSHVNERWVGVSHLLLAAATHTPSVGFSSYQLYLDGRFLGHHGLGWGLGEPSGLRQGRRRAWGQLVPWKHFPAYGLVPRFLVALAYGRHPLQEAGLMPPHKDMSPGL